MSNIDNKVVLAGSLLVTTAIAGFSTYKLWCLKRRLEMKNIYESSKYLNEYLLFDYGSQQETLKFDFGPKNGLDFPKRTAELCMKHFGSNPDVPMTALDIGCAVGRASFELCREFKEVVGVDFSASFIEACRTLQEEGSMVYSMTTEGFLEDKLVASVSQEIDRNRATFRVGDACCLPADLDGYGCVLAANLICRLPRPDMFLLRCSMLVAKGGLLVITSPYTFMTQYTAPEHMIGGYIKDGKSIGAFEGLKAYLEPFFEFVAEEDMPFLIRETRRKHQYTVAHATVWRRK